MTKEKGIKFDLVFFKKNIALILFLVLLVFNIVATNNFRAGLRSTTFLNRYREYVLCLWVCRWLSLPVVSIFP